jgi:hypothetical protein
MYDTVLFLVMVSLAGVILLPALQTLIMRDTALDTYREQTVDDALQTFLVTRLDTIQYRFCGNLVDDIAEHIGINTSGHGLYENLTRWLLAHEQNHKTFATLLAEKLGCEFCLPFSILGTRRLNIFTSEFDVILLNETRLFFSSLFGEKYQYNLTAWWHPLKTIPFGGEFFVGKHPPLKNCYVARTSIPMPYTPIFSLGNRTIVFTKEWLQQQLFSNNLDCNNSTIPSVANIQSIFEDYSQGTHPYDSKENASKATLENLSILVNDFLIDGITNESNITIFPGIVDIGLAYGFQTIQNITQQGVDKIFTESFGETTRFLDRFFGALNTSVINPLSEAFLSQWNTTFQKIVNKSYSSLDAAFNACISIIKDQLRNLINSYITPLLESFVNTLFQTVDMIHDFSDCLLSWLFDRISLTDADVMLTIWVTRE